MTERDAAGRLEAKLDELIAALDPDELAVLKSAVHIAHEGAVLEGFTVSTTPAGSDGEEPGAAGQAPDPGATTLVSHLHDKVHLAGPKPTTSYTGPRVHRPGAGAHG
jgi:hypothetical protein